MYGWCSQWSGCKCVSYTSWYRCEILIIIIYFLKENMKVSQGTCKWTHGHITFLKCVILRVEEPQGMWLCFVQKQVVKQLLCMLTMVYISTMVCMFLLSCTLCCLVWVAVIGKFLFSRIPSWCVWLFLPKQTT